MMAATASFPFSSSGVPGGGAAGGAQVRSTGAQFNSLGSRAGAARVGNGQIVIARGAEDERLV